GIGGSSLNGARSTLPLVGFGRYEVGCVDVMVADGEEGDAGILARIFYPAEDGISSKSQSDNCERPVWLPRREYLDGIALYRNTTPRKIHFLFDWLVGEKRINVGWQRDVYARSQETSSFPVVLFSHGLSACRHFYSIFCASLASYGFVVAAIEHRDHSACWTFKLEVDPKSGNATERHINLRKLTPVENEFRIRNQQLHKRVTECVKLLHVLEEINMGQCAPAAKKQMGCKIILGQSFDWTQFKGRLDISRTSIAGHSFGGATAIAASAFSTDFTSAVVLDGWMLPVERELYPRAQQPTLFLNASLFQWSSNVRSMLKIGNNDTHKLLVTFNEAVHQSFTDFSLLSPGFFGRRLGLQGTVDPLRCMEAAVELTVQFLRRYSLGHEVDLTPTLERYQDFAFEGTNLDLDESSAIAT
uniref:1-alkyl-2-acetylglycerophosphocholine esterase n=1 Tax=Parascaris univalens TaxID=6257 RepID=A0A914ZD01_PARUN